MKHPIPVFFKPHTMKISYYQTKTLFLWGIILFLLSFNTVNAQRLTKKIEAQKFVEKSDLFASSKFEGGYYVQLEFDKTPNKTQFQQLKTSGIQLFSLSKEGNYLAYVPTDIHTNDLNKSGIQFIQPIHPSQRLSKTLQEEAFPEHAIPKEGLLDVAVIFHATIEKETIQQLFENLEAPILKFVDKKHILTARIKQEQLAQLAALPIIQHIDAIEPPVTALNHENRIIQKVNVLNSNTGIGRNLRGNGVVIGVGDGGELGDHIDLNCRLINEADGTYNSYGAHGDHVSGIIGGAGNLDPNCQGVAPECELVIQKTTNITYNADSYYENYRMVLTNNSYGVGFDCATNGMYNYSSVNLDKQLREYPKLLHCFAAGNNGTQSCDSYPEGYRTVLRYYGAAKNVLTVGAVDKQRKIGSLSSRGPVADGRIKPEICGIGINIVSMGRDYDYYLNSGTSMASPAVTSTIALLYQRYRELNNDEDPDGALMKAIACNTADDLGNKGPDFVHGFGLINGLRAIKSIENEYYLSDVINESEEHTHSIAIPNGVEQVRVMLYWHDVEAPVDASKALVHNLDVKLINPVGNTFLPWVLSTTPAQVNLNAQRGIDNLNNIEQITLDQPNAGTYQIVVRGKDIAFGNQKYYVVYDFIYPELHLTHPIGRESFIPNQKELIQWDAPTTNTNLFKLEYSKNNGASWELIANNIPANKRHFEWTVPSDFTEKGKVRIKQIGGVLVDVNEEVFNILSIPSNLEVDAICEGYLELKWDEQDYANLYEIFLLDCGEMIPIATTEETTFVYEDSNDFEEDHRYWFAVRAISLNGKKSKRCVAKYAYADDSSNCPWHDGKVQYITSKVRGRYLTGTELNNETIGISIKNIGDSPIHSLNVAYQVNDNPVVEQTINTFLAAGEEKEFQFTEQYDFSDIGEYKIDAWINSINDRHHENDSVLGDHVVIQIPNLPTRLPFRQDFDQNSREKYNKNIIGLDGLLEWDYIPNLGGELNITGEINNRIIQLANEDATATSNDLIVTLNMSELDLSEGLYLRFDHKSTIIDMPQFVWMRGTDEQEWMQVYQYEASEDWTIATQIDLAKFLLETPQELGASFQLKFAQSGKGSVWIDKVRLDSEATLSAKWSTFEAERIVKDAHLKWTTHHEYDNAYFEIEMASEQDMTNNQFTIIGMVDAQGQNGEQSNYSFIDSEINKRGIRYYRIKQYSQAGEVSYSAVQAIDFGQNQNQISAYPNPFNQEFKLRLESTIAQDAVIHFTDTSGKKILSYTEALAVGLNIFTIAIDEQLPLGIYFLTVQTNNNYQTIKLVKSK